MTERIKSEIARARGLLAEATPGPWEVRGQQAGDGGLRVEAVDKARGMRAVGDPYPAVCRMPRDYARQHGDAALIAAAPTLLATLCDALESEARRADEADAGAAAMRESLGFGLGTVDVPSCVANGSPCEGSCACHDVEWRLCACGAPAPCVDAECPTGRALASDAGRALLDRLHAAEAESDRLRAIVSYCASAIGSGSACSPRASLEFMEGRPVEGDDG